MSRSWVIQATKHPINPTTWGDSVTISIGTLVPSGRLSKIRITKAMIPYLGQNVVDGNHTLTLSVGGVDYTINIPNGYYNRSRLTAAIMTLFNDALVATPYTIQIFYNLSTFLSTIDVREAGSVAFTLAAPSTNSPSILKLYGFGADIIEGAGAPVLSTGPLNIITDRFLYITCDEARGAQGELTIVNGDTWVDGVVSVIDIDDGITIGDVIPYNSGNDAKWINLVRGSTNGTITLRLVRTDYDRMGVTQINWTAVMEVVPLTI